MKLTGEQKDLLKAIADLIEREEGEVTASRTMRGGTITAPRVREEIPADWLIVQELLDDGLIAKTREGGSRANFPLLLTSKGREVRAELAEVETAQKEGPIVPTEARSMALDWESQVLPVLKATMTANESAQEHRGVMAAAINAELSREANDPQTGRVLEKLVEAGYLTEKLTADQAVGPLSVDVAPKTLELLAGRPTERGDIAFGRLIELLEERIEATEDPVDKSRLETMLDSVKNVGEAVASRLITEAVLGGGV